MNWVDQVVAATVEAESPERFYYWSSLAAISAVAKKSVFMDRYYYKLYPNIYVFLIARSGLRKSNPVVFARKIVQLVNNTRVIAGRNSIQAVLKDIGKAYSTEDGGILKDAHAFMVSGELASFLIKDPEALTILTDLHDTSANEPEWKNTTKTAGVDTLKNPCITLLGASNEVHFQDAVPSNAIGGGFMARTFVVLEHYRRTINDLLDAPKITPNYDELGCYLKELAKVTGQFKLDERARMLYRGWYKEVSEQDHSKDKTGTMERIGDQVLKAAMLISLADSFELTIKEGHMHDAISRSLECIAGLKQLTMGAGNSPLAASTGLILKMLIRKPDHQMSRQQLLSAGWGDFDAIDLDRIMETLIQAGAVHEEQRGKNRIYTMKKSAVEMYAKFKQEIM